jgi:dipeptidase
MPNPIGGVLWFGVDDTYSTCYVPIYCGVTQVPNCFKEGNGDMMTYSPTSAFWLFNLVTQMTYLRYNDMIKDVQKVQTELENGFVQRVEENDRAWVNETEHNTMVQEATRFSLAQSQYMFNKWKRLSEYLLVKYIDGNIKKEKDGKFENNGYNLKQPAFPLQPKYPDWFYREIVNSAGDNLKVVEPTK